MTRRFHGGLLFCRCVLEPRLWTEESVGRDEVRCPTVTKDSHPIPIASLAGSDTEISANRVFTGHFMWRAASKETSRSRPKVEKRCERAEIGVSLRARSEGQELGMMVEFREVILGKYMLPLSGLCGDVREADRKLTLSSGRDGHEYRRRRSSPRTEWAALRQC